MPASQTRTSPPLPAATVRPSGETESAHDGAGQPAQRPQGRRHPGAGGRQVLVDPVPTGERRRALERGQGLRRLAEGEMHPAQQLVSARVPGVGCARLLHPPEELRVRQAALRPGREAGVVGRLQVRGLGLEGAAPEHPRLAGAAEVHEGHRAVVEGVGGAPARLRLLPRVGPARERLPGVAQRGRDLGEVVGPLLGRLAEAAGQEIGHRLRHRGETARREPVAAVRVEHLRRREPVLPGPTAEEALEHGEAEAPQVRPAVERSRRRPARATRRRGSRRPRPRPSWCGRRRRPRGRAPGRSGRARGRSP